MAIAASLLATLLLRERAPEMLVLLGDGVFLLLFAWLVRTSRAHGLSPRMQEVVVAMFLVCLASTAETLAAQFAVPRGEFRDATFLVIDAVRIFAGLLLCHALFRRMRASRSVPPSPADLAS